jgi:type IV pilus assembly protein PilC
MPYFICRIASEEGKLFSRSILASSPDDCRRLFEGEGFCVLSVRRDWNKVLSHGRIFGRQIKDKDFILFNQELMALIKSGAPILRSIETISNRVRNVALREILLKVEKDIRSGKSLSESFIPFENRFSKVFTASLMAGEKSGNLPGTIGRYITYAKTVSQTKARIRAALIYPTLLLVFAMILMGVMVMFILPRFAAFFRDFEARMPAITTALIGISLFFRRHAAVILAAFFILSAAFFRLRRKERFQEALDRLKLKIPFGKTIWRETAVALFCRTLGLMLDGGITLLSAIGIAYQAVPNRSLNRSLKDLPEAIKSGQGLTDSLSATGAFPGLALDMIRIGESSANLPGMLAETADFYDERIRAKIDTLVSLIEPVVLIFMGLMAAGMLLAVYLPIINIIRVTR